MEGVGEEETPELAVGFCKTPRDIRDDVSQSLIGALVRCGMDIGDSFHNQLDAFIQQTAGGECNDGDAEFLESLPGGLAVYGGAHRGEQHGETKDAYVRLVESEAQA